MRTTVAGPLFNQFVCPGRVERNRWTKGDGEAAHALDSVDAKLLRRNHHRGRGYRHGDWTRARPPRPKDAEYRPASGCRLWLDFFILRDHTVLLFNGCSVGLCARGLSSLEKLEGISRR